MSFENFTKEIVSAFIAVVMLVAFIPVFQELGVNYSFIFMFIIAVLIAVVFTVIAAVKRLF